MKEAKLQELQRQTQQLEDEVLLLQGEDSYRDAQELVTRHIGQLHRYNELRDIAMSLMTMIADQRHTSLSKVADEIGADVPEGGPRSHEPVTAHKC